MGEKKLGRGIAMAFMVLLIFFVMQYSAMFLVLGVKFIYQFASGQETNLDIMNNISSLQIWVTLLSTLFAVLLLWGIKWVKSTDLRTKGLPLEHGLALAVLLLAMAQGCSILLEYLHIPDWVSAVLLDMIDNPWGVLAVAIVGPIGEEVLFRAGAISQLRKYGWSSSAAIAISALLFGIAHMNPVQTIYATILGLLLGWVYIRTKSLILCIVLHILNNLSSVIISTLVENPNATSEETFGKEGAMIVMVVGLVLAGALFNYLRPRLKEMY